MAKGLPINKRMEILEGALRILREDMQQKNIFLLAAVDVLRDKGIMTYEDINNAAKAIQNPQETGDDSSGEDNQETEVLRVEGNPDPREQISERDS